VPSVIVSDVVAEYLARTRDTPDPVLAEMEEHGARERVPIVVPETGALLHVLALAAGARRILEVGTAIGVSTLYLARALPEDGVVVTFEVDAERQSAARRYLERAGVAERVDLRLQDAREGLEELDGQFDFAFLDGVKAQYGDYFDGVLPRLRAGGVLAVDNVLRSGRVASGRGDAIVSDEEVALARKFNQRLLNHDELTATIASVGDGVLIAVKRPPR
jgi:predicted O-methyltransferase YrrM